MIKRLLLGVFILIAVIGVLALQMGGEGTVNGQAIKNYGAAAPTLADAHEPLDLLIFGGTSGIGFETTKLAIARGHRVTSITRRPERMVIEHENLLNLKGDITDRSSFDHLLVGKNAVISTIGLKPNNNEVRVYSDGMTNVLAAASDAGVNRILTITGIGAGDSKGHGGIFYDRILNPLLLKADYADKTRQENILKSSDSFWTIIRPGFLIDEASTRGYRVLSNTDGLVSGSISRADVAHFLIASLENDTHVQETVFLSN
ncbi:MAG: putative NADH-flavin reductase [Arenicella sp.]|jgi:putative NADH-flavin reductase